MSDDYKRLQDVGREVDLDLAIRCSELAKIAYRPPALGAELATRSGYRSYDSIAGRSGRDFAIVVSDERMHYVVFRGTARLADWQTNLTMWPSKSPFGSVHSGYYAVCTSLLPGITRILASLQALPTVLCGHSMGGALALLIYHFIHLRCPFGSVHL